MLKKILPLLILLSFSKMGFATVIELDNYNSIHCRQQLTSNPNGRDTAPVVMVYMKGCPWADKLRPVYEEVSNEFPHRALFAFNFSDITDPGANATMMRTAIECLGTAPFASPDLIRYNLAYDGYPLLLGIEKLGLEEHGNATREDIINFIGDFSKTKSTHVTLLKK